MDSINLYQELAGLMAPEARALVIAALRQDALVWNRLQEPAFLKQAAEAAGGDASRWTPARLALAALNVSQTPEALQGSPMVELEPSLVDAMLQAYQNARSSQSSGPETLEEAGLLALALREKRRKTGSWKFMSVETQQRSGPRGEIHAGWRAAVACLVGLAPESDLLLQALLPPGGKPGYEWFAHALLTQPDTTPSRVEMLLPLLKAQPLETQLGVLRCFSLHGQAALASDLAGGLVTDHPAFATLRLQTGFGQMSLSGLAARAFILQQLAALYQINGNRVQAASLLQSAEGALKHWMAGLSLQGLTLGSGANPAGALSDSRLQAAFEQARRLEGELGAALAAYPLSTAVMQSVPSNLQDPVLQIRQAAQMAAQGETTLAREVAVQAAGSLIERVEKAGLPFWGEFVSDWEPRPVIRSLAGLGLAREAVAVARALFAARPLDAALAHDASLVCEQAGEIESAREFAQAAAALLPQSAGERRRLGQLWMAAGDWSQAQSEFEAVVALCPQADTPDRLALAQAALNCGAVARVVEVCESILKDAPENGTAAGYLGQALAAQGEVDRAITYLSRATLYAPSESAPWLALAGILRERQEIQRALETLRSAVLAIPAGGSGAAEAHLALGEICLANGLSGEALPALRQAFTGQPTSVRAAYLYGKTLLETGKGGEALAVLEHTRPAWEADRSMAYTYALAAREARDLDGMIAALEAALRPGAWEGERASEFGWDRPEQPAGQPAAWHLLYVRALLGDLPEMSQAAAREPSAMNCPAQMPRDVRLHRVEQSLRRVLEREPAHYEARFYKAQLSMEKGDPEAALSLYRALAEIQSVPEHELYGRVQWGIGRAALCLGQADTALAALKEASQILPGALGVQRDLAEACVRVDLLHEALLAAQQALQLAPDQVDNLVWYAGFVAALGENRAALDALECAIQLDPARYGLRTMLAEWLIEAGKLEAAQAHLAALRAEAEADAPSLRKAAHLYLVMDEAPAALECLERAVKEEAVPGLDLLYDVARLLNMLGRGEEALVVTQQALADTSHTRSPLCVRLYMLQADLHKQSGRLQAALASLEKVLRVAEELAQDAAESAQGPIRAELGEIHEQFAGLLVEMGSLPEAFYHAEKALEIHPQRASLRYKAAGLAFATLQVDRAARIVEGAPATHHQGLRCLKVEIGLELEPGLGGVLFNAKEVFPDETAEVQVEARLLAAQARRLARRGAWLVARQWFERALAQAKGGEGGRTPVELWLAEAALETQQWTVALSIFDTYARQNPNETRAHFALARALVVCAERRRLCQALDCRAHAPDAQSLADAARQQFEGSIQAAARLAKNQGAGGSLIRRWQARGEAVFQPSVQAARELTTLPHTPEDTVALISVLGMLGRRSAAVQAAQRYPEDPNVRMHLVINRLQEPDLGEVAQMARKLAEEHPDHPLVHALLARVAALAGSEAEALAAYQQALALWPGEAGWHDSAGDLAFRFGQNLEGMTHREQALALEPSRVSYALKLGEACLNREGAMRAVEVLEAASKIEQDRSEIWIALSRAYQQAGKIHQALEAALQVGMVDPASGQGYLLAAEISADTGQMDHAVEYARKAVLREPEDTPALLMLARVLEMQDQTAEAVEVLENAPATIREGYEVAFEHARLLYRQKGAQEVLDLLETLAGTYPEEPNLLTFLAFTQNECGDALAAERSGFKSLRLNPNQPELALLLGRLEHKAGQLDQALHLLSEAVRLSPERVEALLELAAIYQERRESANALQVYRQAIRIAPSDYRAYYQSGLLLRDGKDYTSAESMLRRAVDLAPENTGIRRQLLAVIALNLVHNKQDSMSKQDASSRQDAASKQDVISTPL